MQLGASINAHIKHKDWEENVSLMMMLVSTGMV